MHCIMISKMFGGTYLFYGKKSHMVEERRPDVVKMPKESENTPLLFVVPNLEREKKTEVQSQYLMAPAFSNPFTLKSVQFQLSPGSLTRNVTSHSMKSLAFHSLLR